MAWHCSKQLLINQLPSSCASSFFRACDDQAPALTFSDNHTQVEQFRARPKLAARLQLLVCVAIAIYAERVASDLQRGPDLLADQSQHFESRSAWIPIVQTCFARTAEGIYEP